MDAYVGKETNDKLLPTQTGYSSHDQREVCTRSYLLFPVAIFRFLQGWDHTEADLRWNIPLKDEWLLFEESGDQPDNRGNQNGQGVAETRKERKEWRVPHSTVLPGLQFSLAGIVGKPETFYQVPVIRFVFEIFGHL